MTNVEQITRKPRTTERRQHAEARLTKLFSEARTERAFTIAERLRCGSFRLTEAKELAGVSHTKIYEDAKKGLITIRNRGRQAYVAGPDLAKYCGLDVAIEN